METPQDLIKPVPPSPGGNTTPRGPVDAGRKSDGGTDFAEAMRTARESSRPEVRETQAPGRQTREVPEEASDEPIYASKDKDLASESPPAPGQSGSDGSTVAATGPQSQPATTDAAQQAAPAAAVVQAPIAPVNLQIAAAPADSSSADDTIQAITRSAAPIALQTIDSTGSSQPVAAVETPAEPSPASRPVAVDVAVTGLETTAPATSIPAVSSASQATTAPTQPLPVDASGLTQQGNRLPAAAEALPTSNTAQPAATSQAAQVALAPTTVALAVDRAIGNAIVERPATGSFKPADLAAQPTVDPARIASAGFVAATLQPVTPKEAPPALSPIGEPLMGTEPAEASAWLTVRPDSLAMALAQRALDQDAAVQLPLKLDQTLQSIDMQLQAIVGKNTPVGSAAALDAEAAMAPLAATGDVQANGALQIQPQNVPADNAPEPVSLSLNAPMQQASRWATEFGDRLAWVANNRFGSATLQVNPPQLGPIEVRIQMSGDQAAVSFAAVQPQTREAIQQALPVLASSLASQGLSLGQTSVGRDHLPQQGGQGGGSGSNSTSPSGLMAAQVGSLGSAAADGINRGGNGLVDTFV